MRVFDTDVSTRLPRQAVPYLSRKLVLLTKFDYNNREARMSTQGSEAVRAPRARIERIALGSDRAAKIMAVRASIARVAEVDSGWREANVVARSVVTDAPTMPLTDWELMSGARQRALAVRKILIEQNLEAELYVGLEGGFHSISVEGDWHTFLRGWAFVTDGERDSFGMSPSIMVPPAIVKNVIEGKRELGLVIDEVAGARDVRSRQGAWGILSKDLLTRSMSFEAALIAAFAPFYNPELYSTVP
jgi:inosine/xanthosine triphosphatase